MPERSSPPGGEEGGGGSQSPAGAVPRRGRVLGGAPAVREPYGWRGSSSEGESEHKNQS